MGIVFDLDDTLVPEADYVRSGFRAVARHCDLRGGGVAEELFDFLWKEFLRGVRGDAFNRLLGAFSALGDGGITVEELVSAYRHHQPDIALAPPVRALLTRLAAAGHRLGLISDGPLAAQSTKVAALELDDYFAPILLTDRWGREYWKPHRRAFEEIERQWGESGGSLWYIGDNPHKDFLAPAAMGWRTVRLWQRGQQHFSAFPASSAHAPAQTVTSWEELARLLDEALPPPA